jgi:hypothetical protein
VRIGFYPMLVLSLALHLGLGAGIAVSYFYGVAKPGGATLETSSKTEAMMLVTAQEKKTSLPAREPPPSTRTVASTSPAALPVLPQVVIPKSATSAPVAMEINPNAHVRALPVESVLSPTPAPRLNSADGIVFILDISGSMYEPYNGTTRLALARQSLSRRILALKDGTPFAIALYALRATTSGPLVLASNATREAAVRFIMRDVDYGGGTNLPAGLAAAQELHPGALVIVSDGDLNTSTNALTTKAASILGSRERCPSLTVLGIAPRIEAGGERILQKLADYEGGTYRAEQFTNEPELVTSAASLFKPASTTP